MEKIIKETISNINLCILYLNKRIQDKELTDEKELLAKETLTKLKLTKQSLRKYDDYGYID